MSLKAHLRPRRARSALGRGLNGRLPAHRFEHVSNISLAGMIRSGWITPQPSRRAHRHVQADLAILAQHMGDHPG